MIRNITKNLSNNKKVGEKTNFFRVSMKTRIVIFSIVFVLLCISYLLVGFERVQEGTRKILTRIGIYTEEIRSVEMESSNYDEPGSWHVEKSAEWIGTNQAQVTFKVDSIIKTNNNYKDIILVLDVSGSMAGSKMEKAITDSKNLVEYVLSDENNRVSIITFSTDSTILTPFSNDKDLVLSKLDIVATDDSTNYNAALLNVDEVMSDYVKEPNRDVVTLFLTDGYPNKDTPNQIGTYTILKDKYPYMDINGIQYEMGKTVISDIKKMTDAQWIADQDNLHNVLLEASISPMRYEKFVLTDYIDDQYFKIGTIEDINASKGNVTLDGNKIIWDLGRKYVMGEDITMTINISLNEEYATAEGFYPTNEKAIVLSKVEGERYKEETINDTPVLKNLYDVVYDTNTPDGCSLESIPTEQYFVYQRVNQNSDELSCNGYVFKGWEVEEETSLERINDNMFYMPGHDIHIRAVWSKQSIVKTMNGSVHEKDTLYKVLQRTAETGGPAKEYIGEHQDSMDSSLSTEKIYTYSGGWQSIIDKNNVIFAGHCWQMIRTTDTGGVKLLYNGEVENNQCLENREQHVGYNGHSTKKINGNYWYGTDYIYDQNTKTFRISGEVEQKTWSAVTGTDLVGKYTCMSTLESGECTTLYLIESYIDSSSAITLLIDGNSHYSQYGIAAYNDRNLLNTLMGTGYMYDSYQFGFFDSVSSQNYSMPYPMLVSSSLDEAFWIADSVEYNATRPNEYSLLNSYQVSDVTNVSDLVGKYTFLSNDQAYGSNQVGYIVAINDGKIYYKSLLNGEMPSKYEPIQYGDSITDNGDGTYTLNNVHSVSLVEWYNHYDDYINKYTCHKNSNVCERPAYIISSTWETQYYLNAYEKILLAKKRNGTELLDTIIIRRDELVKNSADYSEYKYTCNNASNICTNESLRLIESYHNKGYNYIQNRFFGESVTWDGANYTLVNPLDVESYNDLEKISTHHFVCLDPGKKTCSSVAYIFQYSGIGRMNYVILTDGITKIEDVLSNILNNNTTNSIIKSSVDLWYKKHLLSYSDYIEDTIFCNNREIDEIGGWIQDGGRTNIELTFKNSVSSSNLKCERLTDQFSVSNDYAKLIYPVGLITHAEVVENYARGADGAWYWTATPYNIANVSARVGTIQRRTWGSSLGADFTHNTYGVRPSISLIPGIEYIDGDGSRERPYYIETE